VSVGGDAGATTPGYSGRPLADKLGIKRGTSLLVLNAPEGFQVEGLPSGVRLAHATRGTADVILAFFTRRADLSRRFERLRRLMAPATGLWIAWPKRASGVETDLTEDVVREIAVANGLVDNKVCAVDETWSGLRLVIRLRDR
jgi:hypothetical protein